MKNFILELLDGIYLSLKYSLRDITIFPGENLIAAFNFSLSITIISTLCFLLDLPRFIDWRGGVLGTAILGILILIGRRRDSALFRDDGVSNDSIGIHASKEESSGNKG